MFAPFSKFYLAAAATSYRLVSTTVTRVVTTAWKLSVIRSIKTAQKTKKIKNKNITHRNLLQSTESLHLHGCCNRHDLGSLRCCGGACRPPCRHEWYGRRTYATLISSRSPRSLNKKDYNVLLVVQGVHGGVGILLGSETDETESTAAEGVTVLDDNLQRVSKGKQ